MIAHSFMPGDLVTYKGQPGTVEERGALKSTQYVKIKLDKTGAVKLVKNDDIKNIRRA